jgi:hypothetical protein
MLYRAVVNGTRIKGARHRNVVLIYVRDSVRDSSEKRERRFL